MERYGASPEVIEKMPLFMEQKLDDEKQAAYEAQMARQAEGGEEESRVSGVSK